MLYHEELRVPLAHRKIEAAWLWDMSSFTKCNSYAHLYNQQTNASVMFRRWVIWQAFDYFLHRQQMCDTILNIDKTIK